MMNIIWAILLISGLITAFFTNRLDIVTNSLLSAAQDTTTLCISLLGVICFWNGIMNIAIKSGIINKFATLLKPLTKALFPDIPQNHPAMYSIVMNLSANMLGLGNAATPFGLRAMQEMQKLNLLKDEPTDDMCMFLIVNNSIVQLLPTTVIALRASMGSQEPTSIISFIWITTIITCISGIFLGIMFKRIYNRRHR